MKEIIGAGGLVLNQENELLMIFRRSKWDLPKGHLDEGETLEKCAVREVKEETGLTSLVLKDFIGFTRHVYFDRHLNADAYKKVNWFRMEADKNESFHPQVEESIEWIRWVPQNELKSYLHNSYENIREIISLAGLL